MPILKKYPAPVIKSRYLDPTKAKREEVTYPVSYTYNGGIIIDDEWYDGFEVPRPIVQEGFKLVGIGVGLDFNARPPQATCLLVREE